MGEIYHNELKIDDHWHSLIERGIKTVEIRKADFNWRYVKPGVTINIVRSSDGLILGRVVKAVRFYHQQDLPQLKDIDDKGVIGYKLLKYVIGQERITRILPGIGGMRKAVNFYFGAWTSSEIFENGLMAIEF